MESELGQDRRKSLSPQFCSFSLIVLVAVVLQTQAADHERDLAEDVKDPSVGNGLILQCTPFAGKSNFVSGTQVKLMCVVSNATETTKPVIWGKRISIHFCLVPGETNWWGGTIPRIEPQLRDDIGVTRTINPNENVLHIPPHSYVNLVLTLRTTQPEKFRGRVVYDPEQHGGVILGDEGLEKAKRACAFSNVFEYEITGGN